MTTVADLLQKDRGGASYWLPLLLWCASLVRLGVRRVRRAPCPMMRPEVWVRHRPAYFATGEGGRRLRELLGISSLET